MWIQTGDKEPVVTLVLDQFGEPLTGKTDTKLKAPRRGNGTANARTLLCLDD